jgi:hypothetical protein
MSATLPVSESSARTLDESQADEIRHSIAHAAHLLPTQGPIEVFVHHNTLHAYEELSFHEAVKAAYRRFGANPYFPEAKYRELLASGRITVGDLEGVLNEELGDGDNDLIDGLGTRLQIRLARTPNSAGSSPRPTRWKSFVLKSPLESARNCSKDRRPGLPASQREVNTASTLRNSPTIC